MTAAAARYVLTWRNEQEAHELIARWGTVTACPGRPGGDLGRSMAKALDGLLRMLDHGTATIRAGLVTIAERSAVSVRTVQRAIAVAERAGVLEVTRFPRKLVELPNGQVGWHAECNRYRVRLDVLERLAAGRAPLAIKPILSGLASAFRLRAERPEALSPSPTPPPHGLSGLTTLSMNLRIQEPEKAAAAQPTREPSTDGDWTKAVATWDFAGLLARLRGDQGMVDQPDDRVNSRPP